MLLSAWDLVKRSVDLYRDNARLFITYLVAMYLPPVGAVLLALLIGWLTGDLKGERLTTIIIFIILMLLAAIMSLWISLAFLRVIGKRYTGQAAAGLKTEIMKVEPVLWPAIGASILSALAIIGGFILLLVPAIIFAVWFAFVLPAAALDEQKHMGALHASKALVRGRWWGVLGRLLLPAILTMIISYMAQIPAYLSGLFTTETSSWLATLLPNLLTLIAVLINVLLVPFAIAAQTILYLELKKTPPTLAPPVT